MRKKSSFLVLLNFNGNFTFLLMVRVDKLHLHTPPPRPQHTRHGISCPCDCPQTDFPMHLPLLLKSQTITYAYPCCTGMGVIKAAPDHTWGQFFCPQTVMWHCWSHSTTKQGSWRFAHGWPGNGCCSPIFPTHDGWWQGDKSEDTVQLSVLAL